jgi:enediyne biosynthesis protein E4
MRAVSNNRKAGCRRSPGLWLAALTLVGAPGCRPTGVGRPDAAPAATSAPVRFVDVTAAAGIRFRNQSSPTPRKYFPETMGSGGAFIDYDGDGWPDLLLLNGAPLPGGRVVGRPTMALYHNNRNGTFTDVTRAAGLDREVFYGMGVAVGDYDDDGRDDFYVSGVLGSGHLFHNEGVSGGPPRFRDVTAAAGVGNKGRWGTSCAWLDYDRDGRLDLFVCNYVRYGSLAEDVPCFAGGNKRVYCIPTAYEMSRCVLYHNEGGGRFKDVSAASGIGAAQGKSLGVAVWDDDGDGWPDLFVANDTVAGFQFHNEKNGTFREVGLESGVAYDEEGSPHSGMGIDAGDLLNDGGTWLAIANFQGQQTTLYREVSPGAFQDVRASAGVGAATAPVLGFGLCFFDFDNDGYLDILQVNGHVQDDIQERQAGVRHEQPTLLFRNQRVGKFAEVGLKSGPPFSRPIVGRGAAWADIDNDGRLDVLITTNNGPALLWRNETPAPNHWLTLKLIGGRSNRDGTGAMVRVTAGGITQRQMVRSGSSYLSQSDLRPHFGLGEQRTADVEIRWPSGTVDRVAGVPADGIRMVREGSGAVGR